MKHPHTHLVTVTASSSNASSRGVRRSNKTETRRSPTPATHPGEPIGHCYRTLLETSSSAILLLSPESIILGWNRTAETVSGRIADEALSRSYGEGGILRLPQGTLEAPADD
jgi:PAS domain-containing protein